MPEGQSQLGATAISRVEWAILRRVYDRCVSRQRQPQLVRSKPTATKTSRMTPPAEHIMDGKSCIWPRKTQLRCIQKTERAETAQGSSLAVVVTSVSKWQAHVG